MSKIRTFKEFYPFYLSQHNNKICRALHFIGSFVVIVIFIYSIMRMDFEKLIYCPLVGYFFAWIGHFVFEKNRPATFTYPIFSLMGDWVMFKDILIGKIKIF